jgi:two-component system response regulator NreC
MGRAQSASGSPVRVVIADDHPVVRSGLRSLLEAEPDFDVVAEAGDAASAERHVRGQKPDVLVIDVSMPGGTGIEAIPRIRANAPDTRIVVLTMRDDPNLARQAIQAGAMGYVLKDSATAELVLAVRRAAQGERYLNPQLGAQLAVEPPRAGPAELSARELEVLRLLALGHTNPEIGESLFISTRTVEAHRARINQKLGLSTRAELVRFALEHRLIQPPEQ